MIGRKMAMPPSLAKLLAAALLAATLCNGAGFYLKRTGVWDGAGYRDFWAVHCGIGDRRHLEWQCGTFTTSLAIDQRAQSPPPGEAAFSFVYEVAPGERWLKLAKDAVWALLVAACLFPLTRPHALAQTWRESAPLFLFAGYAALAFAASVPLNGILIALAGLRAFGFIVLAVVGRRLLPHMQLFAQCVAILLLLQLLLVPFELYRGIHLFREWPWFGLARRATGTLVQPNSLGVFAVLGFAFYTCFALSRRWLWPMAAVALALIVASGSGTGFICAAIAAAALAMQRWRGNRLALATATAAAALATFALLPQLAGRGDIADSINPDSGRALALRAAVSGREPVHLLLGEGLGINTNLALNLAGREPRGGVMPALVTTPTDSMFTGLLLQVGVLGTLLFYGMLAWAAQRDRQARPFYFFAAVCSLTMNLGELFPANVLLGLVLAHSAAAGRDRAAGAQAP
jgi:hypothetical protein